MMMMMMMMIVIMVMMMVVMMMIVIMVMMMIVIMVMMMIVIMMMMMMIVIMVMMMIVIMMIVIMVMMMIVIMVMMMIVIMIIQMSLRIKVWIVCKRGFASVTVKEKKNISQLILDAIPSRASNSQHAVNIVRNLVLLLNLKDILPPTCATLWPESTLPGKLWDFYVVPELP